MPGLCPLALDQPKFSLVPVGIGQHERITHLVRKKLPEKIKSVNLQVKDV